VIGDIRDKFYDQLKKKESTFVLIANVKDRKKYDDRGILDRWILSRLNSLIAEVTEKIEAFEPHKAVRAVEQFVVNDVSNWYVRGSRRRFWEEERTVDKMAGYATLYEVLVTLSRLVAPFVPFTAEHLYRTLEGGESVHLCDYPQTAPERIDRDLEDKMVLARAVIEEARALRAKHGVKVRYPLAELMLVTAADLRDLAGLIREEINVKSVSFADADGRFMRERTVGAVTPMASPILPGDSCPSRVSSATSRLSWESNVFFMALGSRFFN